MIAKEIKPKKCKAPGCSKRFKPTLSTQKVCSVACALAIAKDSKVQKVAAKAITKQARDDLKARREKLKSKSDHMRETQAVFNEWIRLRDAALPCISCGRHHHGKYDAGHYRTVGGNPELRFEPLNCHKQCAPCNQHKSGDIVNYRINLVKRIGAEAVEWLEGPHKALRLTIEDLQAIKADYRQKLKDLRRAAA